MILLLLGAALAAPPHPSVVPEGIPAPAPVIPSRTPLTSPLPGARLQTAWLGGQLVVAGDGGALWLVDPATGAVRPATLPTPPAPKKSKSKKKAPPPPPIAPIDVAVGPGGAAVAVAQDQIWVFDPSTGAVRWQRPAMGASTVAWSVDGSAVEGGGNHRHVVWSAATGTPLEAPDTRADTYSYAAMLQRLAVVTSGKLDLYDAQGAATLDEGLALSALALSPDGRLLAGGGDGVWIWDAASRSRVAAREARGVSQVVWSPDGARLAVAEGSGLQITDAQGAAIFNLPLSEAARGLTLQGDTLIWLGAEDLYRAPIRGGDLVPVVPGSGPIAALASGDGLIAAGGAGGGVAVWNDAGPVFLDVGPGAVTALAVDASALATRQDDGDGYWSLAGGARQACAPTIPACAALNAPTAAPEVPAALAAWLGRGTPRVALDEALAEAVGDQIRVWADDGSLHQILVGGADGTWAAWTDGAWTWGAMEPMLQTRAGDPVLPPPATAALATDAATLDLVEGGPAGSASLVLTNTGPGPAYSVRLQPTTSPGLKVEGSYQTARLGVGERVLIPVRLVPEPTRTGALHAEFVLSSLYTSPRPIRVNVSVAAWPVTVERVKRKKEKLKVSLQSAPNPNLGELKVWVLCKDAGGFWTAVTQGEAGKLATYASGEATTTPKVSDTVDLSLGGGLELEYRLPAKNATQLKLLLLVPGGTARVLSLEESG